MIKNQGFGMIQAYYGDGKGKTTAAIGQLMRAHGNGKRVAMIYFDKGGTHYNERNVFDQCGILYFVFGRDRIDAQGRFDFSVTEEDKNMAYEALEQAEKIQADVDLLILDEVLNAVRLKMLDVQVLCDYLDHKKPQNLEVILTGRGLPPEIEQRADLITEMKLVKHYFYKGIGSREGIEW